ncbi:MAG: class I SAM-dependent methyltransferase [Myxococcota bacterium]
MTSLRDQTVSDFGEQWSTLRFDETQEGYYASDALFDDLVQPLVSPSEFKGKSVADIGSGTGRIVKMLARAGASRIVAVEPSEGFAKVVENTAAFKDRVTYVNARGDELPLGLDLDWVVSFGVIHHIPEPDPVMRRAYQALKPGGKMVVWLYGAEGNGAYLALARPLRAVTTRLPHSALNAVTATLDVPLRAYIALCRRFPLPMHDYMNNHIGKFSDKIRRLTIYDQLNPAHAKYYTRQEAYELFERAGFTDIRLHHRHGYSWLVVGSRPPG